MSKILLAEDEPEISHMFKTLFEDNGFEVKVAGDGQQAVDMLKDFRPNIILLDILMPNVDGLAALHMIKNNQNTKNIPVVILTNQTDDSKTKEAIASGADSYILKADIDPHEVVTMVQGMLKLGTDQAESDQ